MITGFLLTLVFSLASWVLGLLPLGTALPSQFSDAVTLIAGYLSAYSWLLPVYQLISALIFVVLFDTVILGFKLSVWVLKLIRPH